MTQQNGDVEICIGQVYGCHSVIWLDALQTLSDYQHAESLVNNVAVQSVQVQHGPLVPRFLRHQEMQEKKPALASKRGTDNMAPFPKSTTLFPPPRLPSQRGGRHRSELCFSKGGLATELL